MRELTIQEITELKKDDRRRDFVIFNPDLKSTDYYFGRYTLGETQEKYCLIKKGCQPNFTKTWFVRLGDTGHVPSRSDWVYVESEIVVKGNIRVFEII